MLVTVADNGEPLSTSEILSSKQKCFANAKSQLCSCYISLADYLHPGVLVQDDTGKKSVLYLVKMKGKANKYIQDFLKPKYVPGKNKK